MSAEQQKPTLELLKMHSDEVRFQVQLNWDRAKSSLAFNVALLALVAGLRNTLGDRLVVAMLLFVAASAALCAGIVQIGHSYYRSARDRRREVEQSLGIALGFVTTPGMSRFGRVAKLWPSVKNILIALHLLLSALSLFGAYVFFSRQ